MRLPPRGRRSAIMTPQRPTPIRARYASAARRTFRPEISADFRAPMGTGASAREVTTRIRPMRESREPLSGRSKLARLGAIAQLGERLVRNQEVAGSSPASSIFETPAQRRVSHRRRPSTKRDGSQSVPNRWPNATHFLGPRAPSNGSVSYPTHLVKRIALHGKRNFHWSDQRRRGLARHAAECEALHHRQGLRWTGPVRLKQRTVTSSQDRAERQADHYRVV